MNLSYFNPFSDNFLQPEPDKVEKRKIETSLNSYGLSEDPNLLSRYVNGFGTNYGEPVGEFDNNSILFETVFANKRQKINFYRSMAMYPFIRKCLTIMADEACCENADGEVATFDIAKANRNKFTESELMTIREEFNYIINQVIGKKELWYYYYKWLIDGELFLEICLNNEGNKVAGVKCLPPYCTLGIYDDGLLKGFIEDTRLLNADEPGETKTFTTNQIAYANYGFWRNNRNDIRGHLDAAIRPLNQLRAIEDALVVYRITRAPEKRIWNIYTGKLPHAKIPEYMQEIRSKYRKQLSIDPETGVINQYNNTQAFTEDIWFSKDADGQGSTVEPFTATNTFNGQLEDLNMFREQVADALQIPASRWKTVEGGGSPYNQGVEGLTVDEASFQKLNKRLREKFVTIIEQIFMVELQVRGWDEKFLDSSLYKIDLIPATDFERMRDLTLAEKRGGVLGAFSQFLPTLENCKPDSDSQRPIFSKQFFLEDLLGLTPEQRIRNDKLLEQECEELIEASKGAAEEGGNSSEDEEDFGI